MPMAERLIGFISAPGVGALSLALVIQKLENENISVARLTHVFPMEIWRF